MLRNPTAKQRRRESKQTEEDQFWHENLYKYTENIKIKKDKNELSSDENKISWMMQFGLPNVGGIGGDPSPIEDL